MKRLLVVVDMQNDFVDGSLGSPQAKAIVPKVVAKIKNWDGDIVTTKDTHTQSYLDTREGRYLPVKHCIVGTDGWETVDEIRDLLESEEWTEDIDKSEFKKTTFGSLDLARYIADGLYEYVEFVGLCTSICVLANVVVTKTLCPELDIAVDAVCCACVTEETHKAALVAMKTMQVDILNEEG